MEDKLAHAAGLDNSTECVSSSLDLFSGPLVDTTIEKCYVQTIRPLVAITESASTIQFTIPPSEDFTDLSESWIKLKVKITTTGTAGDDRGKQIACGAQTDTDSYALVNQPISSLFQSVNIRLNDSLLSDNYGNYPYLSYLTSIFNYSSDVRNTRLRLAGFCTDLDPDAVTAHGAAPASSFKTRAGWTTAAAQPTFIGPIFHGLFHQAR